MNNITASSSNGPSNRFKAPGQSIEAKMNPFRKRPKRRPTESSIRDANLGVQELETIDLRTNDTIIAVMGPTGAGKSSFVNTLSGHQGGVGHTLESCTTDIHIVELSDNQHSKLVIVDTPGFDDTYKSDKEILDMLANWLETTYKRQINLAGIIYLHRISDNRMAGTPLKNLRMFKKLCGKPALKHVVLCTTMWDEVEPGIGQLREDELKRKYWKGMLSQGSTTFRYEGTRESAWDVVDYLLEDSALLVVRLQKELVDLKRQLPETEAGAELYNRLEELVKKQQETLQTIHDEMQAHCDQKVLAYLREEYEEQRRLVESTMQDMEKLKIRNIPFRLLRLLTSSRRSQ